MRCFGALLLFALIRSQVERKKQGNFHLANVQGKKQGNFHLANVQGKKQGNFHLANVQRKKQGNFHLEMFREGTREFSPWNVPGGNKGQGNIQLSFPAGFLFSQNHTNKKSPKYIGEVRTVKMNKDFTHSIVFVRSIDGTMYFGPVQFYQ